MEAFYIGVGSSLVAALLAGALGYAWRGQRFRQKVIAAPERYIDHLDKLIATAAMDGTSRAVINARAIVAARDDLRDSLLSLALLMNSEIDVLQSQLELPPSLLFEHSQRSAKSRAGRSDDTQRYDSQTLFETIEVLSKKWPSKKDQIRYALRKMIAELGLDEM